MSEVPGGYSERETALLYESVNGLAERLPELSAQRTFVAWQLAATATLFVLIITLLVLWPISTACALVGSATIGYMVCLADRMWLFTTGLERSPEVRISRAEAEGIAEEDLPIYTVLVPVYDEPDIVRMLIYSLGDLDYPRDKLDIKLLLEADDTKTVTLAQQELTRQVLLPAEIVLVPPAEPRTKPKACNYGLQLARGEFTTIYDAEDRPEPLQLRRAVAAFRSLPSDVACIQAKLYYHNDRQNLLTRWFTSEYHQWFGYTLPGLMRTSAPIPLGGTSNHMETEMLRRLGAWDPFNVTEDADLGVRLARLGYRTAVLDSVTLEEANSDPINWVRQRSRWYKGYLQTFLVHTRNPRKLVSDLGVIGTIRFAIVTAGTPLMSLVNLVFWFLAVAWELGEPPVIREIFPSWIYYPAVTSLFFGNAMVIYCALIAARVERNHRLLIASLLMPAYWVLMSLAATKALLQLIFQPSYWEKTVHGLGDSNLVPRSSEVQTG